MMSVHLIIVYKNRLKKKKLLLEKWQEGGSLNISGFSTHTHVPLGGQADGLLWV